MRTQKTTDCYWIRSLETQWFEQWFSHSMKIKFKSILISFHFGLTVFDVDGTLVLFCRYFNVTYLHGPLFSAFFCFIFVLFTWAITIVPKINFDEIYTNSVEKMSFFFLSEVKKKCEARKKAFEIMAVNKWHVSLFDYFRFFSVFLSLSRSLCPMRHVNVYA